MKLYPPYHWIRRMLPAALWVLTAYLPVTALADTCNQGGTCISVGGSGTGTLSNEQARQSKEQWDESRSLRKKINSRSEKEFDKDDKATDDEERCNDSYNVNAYWEPTTLKCLDRKTGRVIN